MILDIRNVVRHFGSTLALDGVDLVIERPQIVGLIGRNGAGKTTLLKLIPCLLRCESGSLQVFGQDPWRNQEQVLARMGYLGQDDLPPGTLKAQDLLDCAAGVYPGWDAAMAHRLLERFAIDPRRRLATLSGGQRRAVFLILAVAHRPELLVLDEPAAGLDPVARRELLEAVVDLLAEAGSTVILSSHQFHDIERLAERVVLLHQGRVLADTSLEELRSACRVEVSAQLPNAVLPAQSMVASRQVDGRHRLTVRLPAEEVRQRLQGAGVSANVASITLEDLFIDWTGGAQ